MSILELEKWFQSRCDGDWEHQGGISIETTDNPGWYIKVEFDSLAHSFDHSISEKNIMRSNMDFVTFIYNEKDETLGISCSVFNLSEALQVFLLLDDKPPNEMNT